MKLLILIPSFNTHLFLNKLLKSINFRNKFDILVADDGSSPKLNVSYPEDQKILLYRNEINQGKGSVIKYGIKYALDKGYTHLLTIDGNSQYAANQIDSFTGEDPNIDFLLGSRSFKSTLPIYKQFYTIITSLVINLLLNQNIKDLQCGYRRYRLDSIKNLNLNEDRYLLESEILLKNINQNSIVKNIKIDGIYRGNRLVVDIFKDLARFFWLIARYIFD